jgi:hypothetical protein
LIDIRVQTSSAKVATKMGLVLIGSAPSRQQRRWPAARAAVAAALTSFRLVRLCWGLLVDNETAARNDIDAVPVGRDIAIAAEETAQSIFNVHRQNGARIILTNDERVFVAPSQPRWLIIDAAVRAIADFEVLRHVHHEHGYVFLIS